MTTKGAEVLIYVPLEVTAQLTGQARDFAIAAFRARELSKLSVLTGLIAGWCTTDWTLPATLTTQRLLLLRTQPLL